MVFLGPPGAGKGTQAEMLVERLQITHVSTGGLFRQAIAEGAPVGMEVRDYVESGRLVPDHLVMQLVEDLVAGQRNSGICFDGFPRTLAQAEALDGVLASYSAGLHVVLVLDLPDEVALGRLMSRGRDDDDYATARYRLEVYQTTTAPLIQYYTERGLVARVDGDADIDTVAQRIGDALGALVA
ncbi:MAG: adenylate kinase [Chloroflexi bacterium]|nr:adenylate kinase [Chloroflexota bacterium]